MYPTFIDKMAFSKAHKELSSKLYNKEITGREYNRLIDTYRRNLFKMEKWEDNRSYVYGNVKPQEKHIL
ncbi:hypothetical protein [Bacillus tropicus]|uniref:hypothetical protein n=1 Tax=Bacillus tropicus TaxID=2026188 RepID=UPI0035DEDE60